MRLVLAAVALIALAGCTTMPSPATPPAAAFCPAFEPIAWSAADTPETIRQAKEHNAAYAALCGWTP